MSHDQPGQWPQIDTKTASIARIYDYWLGGKDNFQADREAAELMIQQYPDIVAGVDDTGLDLAAYGAVARKP